MRKHVTLLVGLTLLAGCSRADEPQPASSDEAAATGSARPPAAATDELSGDAEAWVRANYADQDTLMYKSGSVDLDGDGTDELLVYPGGPMLCGSGGCNLVILRKERGGWIKFGELSVTQLPVGVLDTSTNGWRDLWVTVAGGGLTRTIMKLAFDGKNYPANPTVAPAVPIDQPGSVVIEDGDLIRLK